MQWSKEYTYIPQYEYVSTNQYGDRFRNKGQKQLSVACLIAEVGNAYDLRQLILLSHHLNVPVHYDFSTDPQTAYIKIVARESIK